MGLEDRDYYRNEFNKMVNQHGRTSQRPSRIPNRLHQKHSIITWVIIFACSISILVFLSLNKSHYTYPDLFEAIPRVFNKASTPIIPNLTPPSQTFLQEQPLPENGSYKHYYLESTYVAPLTLTAAPDNHYIVKLVDASHSPVLYVFVEANSTVNVKVPLGIYEVHWVYGKKWYGYEHLFGDASIYKKAFQQLVFDEETTSQGTRRRGHFIKFNNNLNGNMPSERINVRNF